MSDFSDRPFVAGSLVGLRAFRIDEHGRLYGPSVAQVFRPGENEAECRKSQVVTFSGSWFPAMYLDPLTGAVTTTPPDPKPEPEVPLEHSLAGVNCTCGFYAYFDGRNDYKKADTIAALIEGYGVCTVGSRGFRAAKARLVAIIEPKPKASLSPLVRERLHRNYAEVPFHASKREALDAHPLTVPPAPTPGDDGFWTMGVTR